MKRRANSKSDFFVNHGQSRPARNKNQNTLCASLLVSTSCVVIGWIYMQVDRNNAVPTSSGSAVGPAAQQASLSTGVDSNESSDDVTSYWSNLPPVDLDSPQNQRFPILPKLPDGDWKSAPVELRDDSGVTLHSTYGRELFGIAQRADVRLILEIGTGFGASAWCIAQGLRASMKRQSRPDKWLFTLELSDSASNHAAALLRRLPATVLRFREEHPGHLPQLPPARKAGGGDAPPLPPLTVLIRELCSRYDFDLVALSGAAAYPAVESACRPRLLALRGAAGAAAHAAATVRASPALWAPLSRGDDAAGWAVYFDATGRRGGAGPAEPVVVPANWTGGPLPDVDPASAGGRWRPRLPALPGGDWAAAPPGVQLQGQVGPETVLGRELRATVQRPGVRLVLEIGAGYGGGSTWCIAQGLRAGIADPAWPDRWLFALEPAEAAWARAAGALRLLPVTVMRYATAAGGGGAEGGAASAGAAAEADDGGGAEGGGPGRPPRLAALLRGLCGRFAFDLAVVDMDGGEPVGPAEYAVLEGLCRPRELALRGAGGGLARLVEGSPGRWAKSRYGQDGPTGWAFYTSLAPRPSGGG